MQGAVQYCTLKKLTKQCLYEKVNKYLVLTSDRVEILALKVYEVKTFFSDVLSCFGVSGEGGFYLHSDLLGLGTCFILGKEARNCRKWRN